MRPTADARVSAPLAWDEIDACEPGDFTLRTMPSRFEQFGDRHAGMDGSPCSLEPLLELARRQLADGQGDAPWPPHYRKQAGEAPRVAPSKRRIPVHPLVEIGRARNKADALAGLERWKARHPTPPGIWRPPTCSSTRCAAGSGRGRASASTCSTSPTTLRPAQEALDPDERLEDDWKGVSGAEWPHRTRARARKEP